MAISERLQERPQETAETLRTPYATFGIYKPQDVLTNEAIQAWHVITKSGAEITADSLSAKLGIERRYHAKPSETTIDMGTEAAKAAIENPHDIDAVIVSTSYPTGENQSRAIAQRLDIPASFHLDIHAACSGFARGLAYMKEHEDEFDGKNIAFITTEKYSHTLADLREEGLTVDPSLAQTIFSDGAVAMSFTYGRGLRILATNRIPLPESTHRFIRMPIDPEKMVPPFIEEPVPQSDSGKFEQNGYDVWTAIKDYVPGFNDAVVAKAGLTPADMKVVIPHQGSGPILKALEKTMPDFTIYRDIEEGNFSSASIPKAWARAQREGLIHSGDKLLLSGFGAGLYAASAVVEIG